MIKKLLASSVAAAILLLSPGPLAIQAAAQLVSAQAPTGLTTVLPAIIPSQIAIPAIGNTATVGQVKTLELPAADSSQLSTVKAPTVLPNLSVPTADQAALPLISGITAKSPFAQAALTGKTSEETPATAKFLADPSSIAPDAKSLGNASDEGAHGLVSAAMSTILGVKDHSAQSSAEVPVSGKLSSFVRNLLPSSSSVKAASAETPQPSFIRKVSRAAWTTVAAISITQMMKFLLSGLVPGPASFIFKAFAGSFLFWGILESITLHEVGHALTAEHLGDVTPRMAGQVSLNPLRFTGPIGATILMVTSMLFGMPVGGFATNVQQDFGQVKNKIAMGKVAVAGPAVNIAIGTLCLGIVLATKFFAPWLVAMPWVSGTLRLLGVNAFMNYLLGITNLIPFGPLDGQKIMMGFVPQKYHKIIDKVTMYLGIALLGLLTLYFVYIGGERAVTQNGAGTPFGNKGDVFIMSMVASGLALWAGAVWPAVVKGFKAVKKAWSDRKILKAGGLSLMLEIPVLVGRAPNGTDVKLKIAAPWSGDADKKASLAQKNYMIAEIKDFFLSGKSAVLISDGSSHFVDDGLVEKIRSGQLLLLQDAPDAKDAEFFLLPASVLGGQEKTLLLNETAFIAASMGPNEKGRRLLTPAETEVVLSLRKDLKMPVYELGFTQSEEHPKLARMGDTENGVAFFVQTDVLAGVANAPKGEKEAAYNALRGYLSTLLTAKGEWVRGESEHLYYNSWLKQFVTTTPEAK
ncbi:MAG: site-2 protease family protein [Elusimicrobiota bacterium]|jgi:Zn-dependent protease